MSGSKLLYVPQINGLDELLALVADDHKYKEHLQAMKDLRDTIKRLLGDLDTHRKVEQALKRAESAEAASEQLLAAAEAEAAALAATATAVLDTAEAQAQNLTLTVLALEKENEDLAEEKATFKSDQTAFQNEKQETKETQLAEDQRLLTWNADLQTRHDDLQRKVEAVNLALTA